MKYLCLIYLDETQLGALPAAQLEGLDLRHLALNDDLRLSGHLVEAEALQPVGASACVRVRDGKTRVVEGPFADAREQVAGFYFIEAHDLNEAIQVASRFPSAPLGTIEVRAVRDLATDGATP